MRVDKGIKVLMAAVIARAVDDLKGAGPRCRKNETDQAMAFIHSEYCEVWCLELGIDYEALKENAAALYRRFLEASDGGGKNRPGVDSA